MRPAPGSLAQSSVVVNAMLVPDETSTVMVGAVNRPKVKMTGASKIPLPPPCRRVEFERMKWF